MQADIGDFGIVVIQSGDRVVLRLIGELDVATAPRVRAQLVSFAQRGPCKVTIDMASLSFIDSSGVSVLVDGLKQLRENGGDLTLESPNANAMKILEITGLASVFAIS
jgi:anti-sigma B factor antagonist